MPPPMSPQGSRAGLITAVVVLSILFVTSAIFAFYYNAEYRRADKDKGGLTERNTQFATNAFQQEPAFTDVLAARESDAEYRDKSVAEILVAQRDNANKWLAATDDPRTAQAKYESAVKTVATTVAENPAAGVSVAPNADLVSAVTALLKGLNALSAGNKNLSDELAAAKQQVEQEVAQRKVVLGERDEKLAEQGQQLDTALAELAQRGTAGDESVAKVQAETERALGEAQKEISAQQQLVAERNAKLGEQARQIEALTTKLARTRLGGTGDNVVRQADGEVVRVPGNDNVFINLGRGDQISPGLTFEVYDRFAGVPAPGDDAGGGEGEDTLPQGKASIEVVNVGPGQSECRIVRQSKGQSVVERDVISNLVYDRNMKYNFVVYGDFDLDGNGTPTPGDADVMRRLITGWGGKLQNAVNVNADFVVLGVEPEVPAKDDEESATDIARREEAEKALEAYLQVRDQAVALNIPVMNQSRFLYYVGYFEQAKR